MPVSASAGWSVRVTGNAGMNADARHRDLIAKRGLPYGPHSTFPQASGDLPSLLRSPE